MKTKMALGKIIYKKEVKIFRHGKENNYSKGIDMERNLMLEKFVSEIREIYNESLVCVLLYGSVARGTDTKESDIDIALILNLVETKEMREKRLDLIVDLELESNEVLSVLCIDANTFNKWQDVLPFYQNVKKEGVVLWKAA